MKTIIKTSALVTFLTLFLPLSNMLAATITLNTGGTINYSAAGIATGDIVIVRSGTTLVVDGTYSCSSLTLGSNSTNGTISFNAGSQLTVTGVLTMGGTAAGTGFINMTNGGKLIMANGSSFTISNAASALTPGTGTIQIAGAMTLPANITTYNNLEINRAASTMNLGVNTICNGYVNVMAGTLHTNAAGNFNLTALGTFTVATGATFVSNNSVVTCQGTVTLNGTITTGTGQLIYKGNFVNNGTYTIGNGTTVFGGTTIVSGTAATQPFYNVQINSGANVTLPAACTVNNNWTNNGGTVNPGTGTVTFNSTTANQSITGTATSHTFYNLTINKAAGFGLAFAGSATTLNVNNLTQTLGNFTACANVNLTGNYVHTAGTFTANSGNMNFNGTGAQTISGIATTFFKLTVNKASGTLTQTATTNSVSNTMIMTAGTFSVGTTTLNGAANFTATGGDFQSAKLGTIPEFTGATYSISGGTITLNGAGNQTLKPSVSYYNVLLGTSGTKTISTVTSIQKDLIVSGTAVFTGNAAFIVGGTLIYASSGSTTLSAGTNVSIGNFLQSTGTFIDNGVQITVTDSLWMRNGGTFTSTGTTLFNTAVTGSINGNVSTTFNKLYKQGVGTLNIQTATSVNTELNISDGTVDAAANSLNGSAAVNMSGGIMALAKTGVTLPEMTGAYSLGGGTVKLYASGTQLIRPINYNNLDLTSGVKTFLNGTTGIAGAILLNNNPTVDLRTNNSTIHYNGSGSQTIRNLNYANLSLGAGSSVKTFESGNTYISGNVSSSGATADAVTNSSTLVFDGTTAQNVSASAIPNYFNLTNNNTSNLTLTGYTSLKNTLTLGSGSVMTNAGSLVFLSDEFNTARLSEVPTDAVFNGFITMKRYIPQIPYNYLHYYHIVGSPVNGTFGAITYDESNNGDIDQGFGCDTCFSTLAAGVGGFRDFGSNAVVFTYPNGAPNIGDKIVNVTRTPSSSDMNDGWNLISNPYPSEILWDNVQLNNVGSSAYVWNGIQYDEHIQGDGYIIPSGQGFWVKASGNGTVTFRESNKTIGDNTFHRLATTPNYPQLVLKMTGNGYSDQADVRFQDDATGGFDYALDAYKLNGHQNAPHLSTEALNGDELAINSFPSLTQNYDIPVVARCVATGSYQMSIETLSGFPGSACITLEDLVTGTIYDLRTTSTFNFTQTGTSVSSARFILHFGAPVAMEIHDAVCENGNYNGSVVVNGLSNGPWSYNWQDASGNVLHSTLNTNGGDSMSGLNSGTYTLIIHNAGGNCAVTSETFTIHGPAPIAGNALVTSASCNGNADGAINLTPAGGQGELNIVWSDNTTTEDKSGLPAGSYALTITDAAGCAHPESIDVSQPDVIVAAITPSASHIYLSDGGWASFANQSTGASAYTWDFGDGSPVFNGVTAAHQYTTAGLYTVTLTARNGVCEASTQQLIMVEQNPTGIKSFDLQSGVSVFSENGLVAVRFNLPYERNVDVRITNILGQEVFHSANYRAFRNTLEAELSDVTEGLYLLHISQENKVVTKKFLFRK